jgi:hypothetical protein
MFFAGPNENRPNSNIFDRRNKVFGLFERKASMSFEHFVDKVETKLFSAPRHSV